MARNVGQGEKKKRSFGGILGKLERKERDAGESPESGKEKCCSHLGKKLKNNNWMTLFPFSYLPSKVTEMSK